VEDMPTIGSYTGTGSLSGIGSFVGEVVFLDGTDPENIKAKVKFVTEGEKNLILKFAKLTKI
jgi:hypothetical protein